MTVFSLLRSSCLLLVGGLCLASFSPGEEPTNEDAQEISRLIRQLDADEFAQRQAASQKLEELGKPALPALEAAAQGDSHEAASRAMAILKTHFLQGQPAMKGAAKEVLERIAKGANATAARHAEELLAPPPEPKPNDRAVAPGLRPVAPALRLGGAIPRLAIAGGMAKRISVKTVNGVKDIDVEEGERKIKIHDDPAKGITLEVTEKKDGKDATQKYEAKNAEELKTKHPEAHKLYEEYSQGAGVLRIGGRFRELGPLLLPVPAPVGPVPAEPAPPPVAVPAEPKPPRVGDAPVVPPLKLRTADTEKQLAEKIQAALNEMEAALEQLAKATDKPGELPRVKERLEAAKKRLDELKAKLAE